MHQLFSGKFTTLRLPNVADSVFLNALVLADVVGCDDMAGSTCSPHARLVCKLLCVALEEPQHSQGLCWLRTVFAG
jgi:hypothetical protein